MLYRTLEILGVRMIKRVLNEDTNPASQPQEGANVRMSGAGMEYGRKE